MFLLTLYLHLKSGNRKSVVSLTRVYMILT